MQERQTKQKQIIYDALTSLNHPTATEVYAEVCKLHSSVSRATVFRVLRGFVSNGRAQELRLAGSEVRYDFRLQQHYHARCLGCGSVEDVYVEEGAPKGIVMERNFAVEGYHVEFYGRCEKCGGEEKSEK